MSTKSPKIVSLKPEAPRKMDVTEIPSEKVLKFSYASFKSERVRLAKSQIRQLVSKMLVHPERKSYFIQEINKLILYELGENKFE